MKGAPTDARRRQALLGLAALSGGALAQPAPETPAPATPAPARTPRQAAEQPPEIIEHPRVAQFLLGSSRQPGEPWRIHVARPAGPVPASGCRVLYLLDGNASFPLAWHALQALQEGLPAARELALVGVGYPAPVRIDVQRRYHDLTPPTPAERMQGRSGVVTGGQEVFLDFIEHDLRSAIARRLAIDPQRQALFGHSLGGLLTLHALYTRPHLFQTWIAADPSLWWDGGSILREEQAFLAGVQAAGNRLRTPLRLLIERSGGSRRTVQPERPTASAAAGAAPAPRPTEVLDSAHRLARVEGLEVSYHRFANESHGSMVAPSIRDGLAFLLGAAPAHLEVL